MEQNITAQKMEIEADERNDGGRRVLAVPPPCIERARQLFTRSPRNPILRPEDMPFPCKAVCNPGA